MREVGKKEFFESFENLRCTTGCPCNNSGKEWSVRIWKNGRYEEIARSIFDGEDGIDRYYLMNTL